MQSSTHLDYFNGLQASLQNSERAIPRLLIDLDRLDHNINLLKERLSATVDFRVVVKSLPSIDLIRYVMQRAETTKLMVFHQPFLTDLARHCDDAVDILLGKPMPIKTASYFYNNLDQKHQKFDPALQIQWLIDTKERLLQYLELAKKRDESMRINLEIDVGLHRGGFASIPALAEALEIISAHPKWLIFSGLMGYDPHVVKLPKVIRSQAKALRLANEFYRKCKDLIKEDFPQLWNDKLIFNGAGSPTVALHGRTSSPLNDISVGSALVKPTTFDIPTLSDFVPACYIATPVLKKLHGTTIPGLESIKKILNGIDSSNRNSFFIYGGFWRADYCFPEGVKQNKIFGASTNQTMINAPDSCRLQVDDFVFLRPHQSEFVFLQFGDIVILRDGEIDGEWKLLNNN